jgi:hypothetical protein
MPQYVLVDPDNNVTVMEQNIDPGVQTKPGYRWLLVEDIPRPKYDSKTEHADQIVTIKGKKYIRSWNIRKKRDKEILDEKRHKVSGIDEVLLLALLSIENKLRRLENKEEISLEEYKEEVMGLF